MTTNTKEWIQYATAVMMVGSGVVMAFLSFFLGHYDIAEGVLWYVAQALTYAGGIFGATLYFKTKWGEFESQAKDYIDQRLKEDKQPTEETTDTEDKES